MMLTVRCFGGQVGRTDLRELLLACCADEAPDVRQSAFALLGDLAKVSRFHAPYCEGKVFVVSRSLSHFGVQKYTVV
jgi:hypothetical protein